MTRSKRSGAREHISHANKVMNYYLERYRTVMSFTGLVVLIYSLFAAGFGVVIVSYWTQHLRHIGACQSDYAIYFMYVHACSWLAALVWPIALTVCALVYKGVGILMLLKCTRLYAKLFFKEDPPEVKECISYIWDLDAKGPPRTGASLNSKAD